MSVSLKFVVISILLAECVSESKGACDVGYWGTECKEKCAEGCYFSEGCNVDNGVCSRCIDGFHGPHCDSRCVENCKKCEKDNGLCETCESSYYGKLCNERCSSNCRYCDINDGSCDYCLNGYWGPNCEIECKPISECDRNCSTVTNVSHCENACKCFYCNKGNGACTTCAYGFWGFDCNEQCPHNCLSGCNIYTGQCSDCIPGYWGSKCQYPCQSENCLRCDSYGQCYQCQNGSWGRQCDKCTECEVCNQYFGICEKCPHGFWGRQCENQCTGCVTCNVYRGYCDSCQPGYWGQKCDQRCPSECTECDIYGRYCTTTGCSMHNCNTEENACAKDTEEVSGDGNISALYNASIVMIVVGSILCGTCVTMMICMIRRFQAEENVDVSPHQQTGNTDGVEMYDRPVL